LLAVLPIRPRISHPAHKRVVHCSSPPSPPSPRARPSSTAPSPHLTLPCRKHRPPPAASPGCVPNPHHPQHRIPPCLNCAVHTPTPAPQHTSPHSRSARPAARKGTCTLFPSPHHLACPSVSRLALSAMSIWPAHRLLAPAASSPTTNLPSASILSFAAVPHSKQAFLSPLQPI
jgi:hypothetical protein